ncbi:hypothetical protein B0H10DRAFT_2433485 [Mycena sp. CBHHK59/15]|nr:hypothetical protein B0H10DRAFT_2433485 [Mycena sp. CBHHK59/15]
MSTAVSGLTDTTNATATGTPDALDAVTDKYKKAMAELDTLKGIVSGLSKPRRRKKRASADTDDELENEAPPTNKVKKSPEGPSNFDTYGRVIMRFIGPFETARTIVDHGLIVDTALSGDEMEEDVTSKRLTESWTTLWQKFPGFHELMLSLSGDPRLRKSICREIASGMEGARSDDTATMKQRILGWVTEDPKTPLNPAIAPGTSKATRGSAHPTFARLLCPLEYDDTPSTYTDIDSGAKDINARQLPRFLFPFNQVNDESALDTVLTGPIMLRASKAVFMGPSSALQGDGYHRGKPPNSVNIGMKKFTPRIIAYIALQVRFNLSSMQEWNKVDGHFDYEEFFWMIVELFDDPEHAAKILTLYNRVVLGVSAAAPPTPDSPAAPCMSHVERLRAERAAKLATSSSSDVPSSDGASRSVE